MAARNLPIPEVVTYTISIDSNLNPNHQGLVVRWGDTVNFTNNSGQDVTIMFVHNPPGSDIYPNMNLPVPNGTTAGFTVPNNDCAGNYSILGANNQETGPWVIRDGQGPMWVNLSKSANVVVYTPQTVAVPLGSSVSGMGMLEMKSNLPNTPFGIIWGTTDPFYPALTATGQARPVGVQPTPNGYNYGAAPNLIRPTGTGGGGTVIIRGT